MVIFDQIIDRVNHGRVNHDEVERLTLRGREHEGDKLEKLDLFRHRERRERTVPVTPGDRRVPCEVRWEELIEIWEGYVS